MDLVKTPVIEPDGNTGQIHLVGVRTPIGQRIFLPGLTRDEITALRDALTAHLGPPVPQHAQHTVDGPQECPRCCLLRENDWRCPDGQPCQLRCGFIPCRRPGIPSQP